MGLGAFRDKFVARAVDRHPPHRRPRVAIAHDPAVLLLDEPSSGIAQRETEALGPLLPRIRDETGCAMLVIEHDMPLITCGLRPDDGAGAGPRHRRGTPQEVLSDAQVIASYLGTDQAAIGRSGAAKPRKRTTKASAR